MAIGITPTGMTLPTNCEQRENSLDRIKGTVTMTSQEAAYIAGFLDGDGTVILGKRKCPWTRTGVSFRPEVVFTCTSREVLEGIQKMAGRGIVKERMKPRNGKNLKQQYTLRLSTRSALKVAQEVAPYAIIKKAQLGLISEYYDLVDHGFNCGNSLSKFVSIYEQMKTLNDACAHRYNKEV